MSVLGGSVLGMFPYLTKHSGGNVSDLVVARNCCMARMLPMTLRPNSPVPGL